MLPDLNLFMMCESINEAALSEVPSGYHIRCCREDELDLWKTIHFDTESEAADNHDYMDRFFDRVYAPQVNLFFQTCLFICNAHDRPVGACHAWKVLGGTTTIHWFKIRKDCEGMGLGRALLSEVMRRLSPGDYPVFLHTQLSSCRAIKLYNDFGFALLKGDRVGHRSNDIDSALPYLEKIMPKIAFDSLRFAQAPEWFLKAADTVSESVF